MQIACTFYCNETYKQLLSANEDKNKSTVKSKPTALSIAVEWILPLPCIFLEGILNTFRTGDDLFEWLNYFFSEQLTLVVRTAEYFS